MASLSRVTREINEKYGDSVSLKVDEVGIRLNGQLDDWNDIVDIGLYVAEATRKRYGRVINDIKLKGYQAAPMRTSSIVNNDIDNTKVDVLVVGGGITGCAILRELTKYNVSCALVEKEEDLALHASSRNDGQVHIGIDLKGKVNKLSYCVRGNGMYQQLCKEIDAEFKLVGQYVIFRKNSLRAAIPYLWLRAKRGHIKGMRVIHRKKLFELEPNLTKDAKFSVYFPQAAVICPYNMTIALAESAVINGAKVMLNTAVLGMDVEGGKIKSVSTNRGVIYPKVVINAAGTFADVVAEMAGDRFYSIHPRKGQNMILDKSSRSKLNIGIMAGYDLKNKDSKKHTKGGGMLPTVDNNTLVGPNAYEVPAREDFTTNSASVNEVLAKQSKIQPNLNRGDIITYFAGTRAACYEEDFVVEKGHATTNLVHAGAIQSPGLTAAPAIAVDVVKMATEILTQEREVVANVKFNPIRKGVIRVNQLDDNKRDELIKSNPDYGVIVCRCEEISKGEIEDCLKLPIEVNTLDGVKRRIRPGMGRCQGGFCQPQVAKIIAEVKGEEITEVCKRGEGKILLGSSKGGKQI